MTTRPGRGKLGCLVTLLVLAAIAYFGVNAGEVYVRYYRFRDAMSQEARFARQFSDDDIRKHLRAVADSLGLPEDAGAVRVRRGSSRISISAQYHEVLELPGLVRTVQFNPSVTHGL